jgi:hypothetical protein
LLLRPTLEGHGAGFSETRILPASDLPEAGAVIIAQGAAVTVQMVEFGYRGERRIEGSPDYSEWDRASMGALKRSKQQLRLFGAEPAGMQVCS